MTPSPELLEAVEKAYSSVSLFESDENIVKHILSHISPVVEKLNDTILFQQGQLEQSRKYVDQWKQMAEELAPLIEPPAKGCDCNLCKVIAQTLTKFRQLKGES